MTSIKVFVEGSTISATLDGKLTSGMVGVPVEIEYNQDWENLSKICIFRVGSFSRQRERVDKTTTVPWEVLRNFGKTLEVGIQGKTEDGEIVIPTVWATVGFIHEGANATIPGAPAPSQGEQPSGSDLIDDGVVSSQKTWSSNKTNSEIQRQIRSWINDDDVDPENLWSSVKVKDYTDSKVAALIDDASIDPDGTWSSEKISEAIGEAAGGSASKQYELIEEVTLEEAVSSFSRNTDTNGVPYDFSAIRIRTLAPKAERTAQIIFFVRSKGGSSMIYHQQVEGLSTSVRATNFVARNDHGLVDYHCVSSSKDSTDSLKFRDGYLFGAWKNVVSFGLATYPESVLIPAGTLVQIYAVRG